MMASSEVEGDGGGWWTTLARWLGPQDVVAADVVGAVVVAGSMAAAEAAGSGSQEVRAACPQGLDRCRHVVREVLCLQQGPIAAFKDWTDKYGDVVGFYNGAVPTLLVRNLDLIKEIQISKFKSCNPRGMVSCFTKYHPFRKHNVFNAAGQRWRDMRKVLKRSLDLKHVKEMSTVIEKSADSYLEVLESVVAPGKAIDVFPIHRLMAADVILRTMFSFNVDGQGRSLKCLQDAVIKPVANIRVFKDGWLHWLSNATAQANLPQKTVLTKLEIEANASVVLLVGALNISQAVSWILYLLARHQAAQDKVRAEIKEILTNKDVISHTTVTGMQYLDQVFDEALRLQSSPNGSVSRFVEEDIEWKGLTIPKGTSVTIPSHMLHHDLDLWQEPDVFDPDRFSPERKASVNYTAFQPFGAGPRKCFAEEFSKRAVTFLVAKTLEHYRVDLSTDHHKDTSRVPSSTPPFIFEKFKTRKTAMGVTLLDIIQSGGENLDSDIGLCAPDAESHTLFAGLFNPVIEDYHGGFKATDKHPLTNFGDLSTLANVDPDDQFVVFTGVRCGRSLQGYPFNPCLTEAQYREMEEKVRSTLRMLEGELKVTYYPLTGMDKTQQQLIDDHFLFKEGARFLQAAIAAIKTIKTHLRSVVGA
ncbi:arginine kinase Pro c 2.0101-like [Ixodes scapularis]